MRLLQGCQPRARAAHRACPLLPPPPRCRPAVLLLNHYAWWHAGGDGRAAGLFYPEPEGQFTTLGHYYDLPVLSLRAAAWREMAAGRPGFQVCVVGFPWPVFFWRRACRHMPRRAPMQWLAPSPYPPQPKAQPACCRWTPCSSRGSAPSWQRCLWYRRGCSKIYISTTTGELSGWFDFWHAGLRGIPVHRCTAGCRPPPRPPATTAAGCTPAAWGTPRWRSC